MTGHVPFGYNKVVVIEEKGKRPACQLLCHGALNRVEEGNEGHIIFLFDVAHRFVSPFSAEAAPHEVIWSYKYSRNAARRGKTGSS